MKHHLKWLAATGLVAALALAGCGSGDDDDPAPPNAGTDVPDNAGVSPASFVTFVLGLSASDESSEPLKLKETFAVPAEETAEPTPLT
jgi:predicted small lipoprotein YifL